MSWNVGDSLGTEMVGRLGVIIDGKPEIFPVNRATLRDVLVRGNTYIYALKPANRASCQRWRRRPDGGAASRPR
jgi:hypothetical protein